MAVGAADREAVAAGARGEEGEGAGGEEEGDAEVVEEEEGEVAEDSADGEAQMRTTQAHPASTVTKAQAVNGTTSTTILPAGDQHNSTEQLYSQ